VSGNEQQSMANPDPLANLAEGYTLWHCTVPPDLTFASGITFETNMVLAMFRLT